MTMNFNKYIIPKKYKRISRIFGDRDFKLLDAGCGQYAVVKVKRIFPRCDYYGLDFVRYKDYEIGYNLMKDFYNIDLAIGDLSCVPDNFFDVVMCTQVIEHITNGLKVIRELIKKVKPGGYIYIDYPGVNTLCLPHINGAFHFCDGKTHIRIYSIREIANIMLRNNFYIIKAGRQRDLLHIILSPIVYFIKRINHHRSYMGAFYDLVGHTEYVFAKKRKIENYYTREIEKIKEIENERK